MGRKLGTPTHFHCGCERSPENDMPNNESTRCRRCFNRVRNGQHARRMERRTGKVRVRPLSPRPDMTDDEAIALYRTEKARAAERHAPAKAQLQAKIEAAWQAQRERDEQAQKGGRPRLKAVVLKAGRR